MLIAASRIRGCSIEGPNEQVGTVKDVLFERKRWTVRYLDVATGVWLPGRRVILSPEVIVSADYAAQRLGTRLTQEQVKNSPPLDHDMPVSRQKEIEMNQYFAWGAYWANVELASGEVNPEGDPDLHSAKAVSGYRVAATDGDIGHVDDFIVDDAGLERAPWEIRYLVVDTRNWLPGRHVLIPPAWAGSVDWATSHVQIGLAREAIEDSPEYDPATPINRQYEQVFFDYYGRPVYWRLEQ
ncbi:MAG: PRC-barrel domain-containing protein [Patescibacteria group bacterium]|nr:PRC-barrel domain-containing protein [Patescibacteria group bacterium]